MKKISTLFKKDPNDLSRVINEIDPQNEWVYSSSAIATRKWDGSACAIINGKLYKRYDVKKGKQVPEFSIPCQEPDAITGHWPHWVLCQRNKPEDKWFFEGFDSMTEKERVDGTYELCGPKVQGNPEKFGMHILVPHKTEVIQIKDFSFEGLKSFLETVDIEGIVFHNENTGEMCKIRKTDFGIER